MAEGEAATFTLTRSGSTSTELTVRVYSIEFFHPDGSGSLDNPTGQYHQVTFEANSDTATLTVTTDFDGVPESSDSLNAVISPEEGSSYRNGDPGQAAVAITDVARVVTIAADQTTVTEGDTATFTLTRTGPTTKAVVVNVSVTDPGSFLRGNHWQPDPVLPTEATFEVASSTATISLQTKDDLRDIPDNNLTVTVNPGTGYSTGSDANSASIAVTDDDVAPTLQLSIDSDSVEEGETLTIRLERSGDSRNPIEVAVVRGYEGEPDRGYTGIDVDEDAISWRVDTDDNDLDEIDRVYRVEILPAIEVPEGAQSEYWTIVGDSSLSAVVRDNDLPLVWIEAEAPSYREFGFGWFRLNRVGRTDHDLEVKTETTQAGHDVNPFWSDLLDRTRVYTIDASSDFESIAWVLAGNDGDEDEGALTIQLLEGSDYRIDPARSSATFRVVDLDPPPTLSIENARVSGSEDGGFIKFTVSLAAEHASRRTVTVDYATTDGTAEAGSDYTETSGVLTFDPLQTTGVISVPVNDDNLAEPDETFTLTLSNLSNAVLANDELPGVSATGTIEDNEPTVSVAARSAEVTEGAPVVFDLTRTGSTGNELTVILGVLALGGLELADKVQRVTFATGDTQATWEHATVDNDVDQPDRQLIAALTPPSSSGLPETYHVNQATARVTVKDNDLPLVTIAAVGSDQTEGESVEFTLTRQGVLSVPLTVDISVTGGDDFITGTRPATATFATGAATHTLTVATADDAPVDDDGEVVVEVAAGSGYRVGDPGSAAVALFDSTRSYPVVSIRADKGVVNEGDDVVFTLSRSAYGLDESLNVRVRVSVTTGNPASLTDGVDTVVSNEEVVFDAGSLTASLVHPTVDEVLNDGNSAVWAVIRLGQYSIRPYPGEAVVWVRDDDISTVTMTPETGEVFENPPNGTPFTVVRTGDTTNWLRLKRLTRQDRRWPAEVLSPSYAAFVAESKIPVIQDKGIHDFQPGQASKTFNYEPRGTGPLGTTSYVEVLPIYCPDDVPGDCGYRPQYKVGTPKSSTIEVLNRDMGVRVVADQASVDEGSSASFTLHRYGGTFTARVSSLTVRVQVTQDGEFIKGVPPQTVTFAGETVDSSTGDVEPASMEGDTTAVVTIPTTNDMVDESNGAITLTILDPDPELYGSNAHSYEVFGAGTFLENSGWTNVATVEVLDDDVAGFSIADASADEADGSLQFTVTLPGSTFETSVDWATKDDAAGDDPATEGKDYAAASGTLTFAPGDTSKTLTVTLNDDDVKEKDETFTIQLDNPVNAALTDATAIGTIDDDDLSQAVFITLDAGTADGVEEGEDVVFNLERHTWLDGLPSQDVARGRLVVGLEIALEGDFVREPVPATAVFEAGVWVATVTVPTIDDALFEPAGSVSLKLVSQGFGLLSNANPVGADVYDNDMPVSVADAEAGEGDGAITFTISLQEPAVTPVTVEVATVDGTATSHGVVTATDFGKDFTAKSETLTFAIGVKDKQFAVTLVDDRWDEAVEAFTVELRNPSYARLQDASATGTVLDNDPQLEATLVPPENKRIDEDTIYPVRFVVELDDSQSLASERGAYLNWTVTPDTATHGEDYVEAGGSIVIPPGNLTGAFEVHLVDDDLFEMRNELFTVTLTRERWVLVDPDNSSKNIKIKDDDVLWAAVVAAAANVVEGSDATFHVWVSGSRPTEDVVVQYELGGTATSGDDYTAPSGTVTIPVGQLSVPIAIGTTADSLHDPNETLVVSLTDITSVGRTVRSNAETRTATVTILDEGSPVVSVEGDDGTEGDALQFTVTLSSTTDAPMEVQWETEQYGSLLPLDERATPGVDYEPGGGTVTILPGEDTGTFLIPTTQDDLAENTERFPAKLTGASRVPGTGDPENVALGAFSAEGLILDDDVAPTGVTLSATPVAVLEIAGPTKLAIAATLNTTTALTEDASVHVTVAGGTATEDEDYTATEVTLIIAAGDLSRTGVLNLTPLDDEIAEGDETVLITGTVDGLDVTPAEVTITDDDDEPTGITLRVTPNSVGEGDEDTVLNVKAVLAGGDRRPIDTTVTLLVEGAALPAEGGGTTTAASDDDFSFSPVLPEGDADPPGQITLTIPAGEGDGTARLTLSLVDDLVVEGDETLQVSGTADGLPVTAAPLTIADNDRNPTGIQLSVTPWDLVEGEGSPVLLVRATLTGGSARTADTLVSLSVHGLSAVAGEDYTEPSNVTLTIPAESLTGSATLTLTLTLLDDDISEDSEELEVRGTNADPGLPVNGALVAIDDNDAAPTGVTLTLDKDQVPEDAGLQQLTVTGMLTGGGKRTVDTTLTLTVSSVTATDADYTYLPAELLIQSGQAGGTGTLLLVPIDDLVDEDDETLEVRGVIHVPGLTVSAPQLVITDNDSAGVTITPTSMTVLESRSNSYTVTLNTQPSADVTVAISGHSGTALTLSGTTLVNGSLTFTPENWSTPQTVTVNAGAVAADTDVTLVHGVSGGGYDSVTAADVVVTIVDVPTNQLTIQVGVTLSRQTLTVPEGGSDTYEVVLGHQPTGDVTVTVTVDDTANNDVTTEEESLVFTTANWNDPQTVTVRAAEDDDALTDSDVTISHTAGGANYEGVTVPGLTVSITENDAVGVTIDPNELTVTEGDASGVSYTMKLTSQPAGDVTITISGHANTDVSIASAGLSGDDELTFTTENWSTAQTVTVKAAEDEDAVTDPDVALAHAISSADDSTYDNLADQTVTVSITEDDAVGVDIAPTTLTVAEGDATGVSYSVKLTSQPAGDVTVTVSGHANTDLSIASAGLSGDDGLTFTTENWSTAQTVTVKAAEDEDAVTDPDVTLAHAISSVDDPAYHALADQSVTVSITENDVVGVTINPTSLTVTEGNATGVDYTVKLTSQPAGDVTITISGHADTDLSIASAGLNSDNQLTFTTANWSAAQTVTVKAAEDEDGVQDADVTLAHAISSTDDSTYHALADQSVTVSITENDVVGVSIDPTEITVLEGDATGVDYTVKLTSQPAGDVTITISGHADTDLTLSGTGLTNNVLTFTTESWATAQTVTVKAAEDEDGVTDADITLAHAIGSTDDTAYDALADQSVTVSITENDVVGVTINPTSLTVTEGDAAGVNYTVVLTSQPAGEVTVTVSGHSGTDLTLSGTGLSNDNVLTFTTENWATAQTVKVTAAEDEDGVTDADVTLAHAISSTGDSTYDALADQSVTVSITEDDAVGVDIDPTDLTVTEGDATGVDYTVKLTSQPAGDVTVTISGHANTDLSLSGTTLTNNVLTFTTANWSTAQTVTVKAAEDEDGVQDADVTLAHAISSTDDSDYDALADQSVTVSITEDDAVGVAIAPTDITVVEGDATGVSYSVKLTSQPAGDVTVTISGHANTDLSIASAGLNTDNQLTFTTENWNTAQTVKVTAAEDEDGVTDADVTLAHAIGSTDDAAYHALADQSVTVSITEDDAVGVSIDPTEITVLEGDATGVSYTVKLTSQPAGDVTVTISGHAGTDLSIASAGLTNNELTFTTENWNTAQTVTVKAAQDEDGVTDADVTLAHAISSTDDSTYDALADQSVTVSITEDDAVGVSIDPTEITVTEGDASGVSYTVVLTSKPAGDVTVTISGHADTDLSIASAGLSGDDELTFTTDNWSAAQTVTVKAAEDEDGVQDADVTLAHAIGSTDDAAYHALADQSVTVSITEDDAVGVTIDPTTLTVTEGDATGVNYTVKLTSQPAGDVTVTISGHANTDLSIASAGLNTDNQLTFTTSNWSTAQTVTVKAAEDEDAVTDPDVTLVHAISSTDDSTYDALADQSVTVSITEDDAVGVTINPTDLTVTEGDASGVSYSVKLTSQPAGDVTVTVTGHSGTDLSIASAGLNTDNQLTFTSDNWSTAQTVTVKAAQDEDAVTDPDVTLVHAIGSTDDSTYDALADQSVTVSITEDDAVGVSIDPTDITVLEGDATGVSYTVKLTSQPAGDVTVTISGHADTDLTLSGTTLTNNVLTFTTESWATAQTVTVKAAEDEDGVQDADVTLAHAISSTDDSDYHALADQSVTVSITEDDAVGVSIDPTDITVLEGDATGVDYTVVLTSQPAGDVTVTISGHANTDLSLSGTTLTNNVLTFTTENWSTAQTVTVKAAEDEDGVQDADVTLAHAISSADDAAYDALADQSVTVSITEDDMVGVDIDPTTLNVTEGDATGVDYSVKLTSQPAGDVTVTISGHADTDLSIASAGLSGDDELTFTTENWNTAQTVTVKAAADSDGVTDADVTLVHAISSADDSAYHALADQSVTVSITEKDAIGVDIDPTDITVTEGDATGVGYTVVLDSLPAGDVTVTISGHAGTDVSIASAGLNSDDQLTFTTANWNTAQTVTVKAAADSDGVTDADVTLTHAITSTDDANYHALSDQSVTVSITEKDAIGVTIDPTDITVTEGDATGVNYAVKLTSQPAGDVTVTISGHADTDLSIASAGLNSDNQLTFTTADWNTAQTVTVKAAEDEDGVQDADVTLAHAISSADDAAYDALSDQTVTVSITEDDAVGVTIDPTDLTVTEGDATGLSYTVKLTSQPAGDVTVTISGHSGTDLTLSGTGLNTDNQLTFTTANWSAAQTVTVKAAEDGDAVTDADVTLAHAISSTGDSTYDALADQSVTVSITEDDAVGVKIDPTSLTVTEGSTADYTVKLSVQPTANVTVDITGGGDVTVNPTSLTFTSATWNTAKTVTVTAAQDDDGADDTQTVGHAIASGSATEYIGASLDGLPVTVTDDDPAVTVSFEKDIHYTIEGASGAAGVEVLLSAPLATEVTIPITVLSQSTAGATDYLVDDSAGYASDPGLTFNPGETFGYVFIRAVLDTVDEQTEKVVLGFGTLPEGVAEGNPNRSTVEIKDAIQVSFAKSSYMVEEGGPGVEVMVKLNKPRNNLKIPLTANGQGGADDSDFTGVPQELVFKGDETEETFTFVAMEDSEEENGEMVRLGFGAFSEGMVAIFPDSAMVMIDDAGAPAPRHFAAYWPTQTSITLTWFTVETAAEYKLEYRKDGESGWTRISGDFDHLPSTSDHREAFGVAAGLECETRYDFRVSARGSGETRNDGSRYPPTLFGSYATTSAQTGECAQEEEVTDLLVSVEPACATLTWTPPSGGRDTGYRVERYSYVNNRTETTEMETLVERTNQVGSRYQDCSAEYRTEGAKHVYVVTALDNDPGPDEKGAFGSTYTSILPYGPSWGPEGPLNVRLTHDTQSSRRLAWDKPRDPWLSTVKMARVGSRSQQVVTDPWVNGYRVERREYRRTEDGVWMLQGAWETLRDEADGDTATSFTDSEDKEDRQYVYRIWAHSDWGPSRYSFRGDWAFNGGDPGGKPENAEYITPQPTRQQVGETPSNSPATGAPAIGGTPRAGETLTADTYGIEDQDGLTRVSYRYQWTAGGSDIAGATDSGYELTSSEEGQTIQVRVTFTDDAGNAESLTSAATGEVAAKPNTTATGLPTISGTPQVGETLMADTSGIADQDGLTKVSYSYQWVANNGTADTDLQDATDSTYTPLVGDVGKTIRVKVTFTDDADNDEALTSLATVAVAATVPTAPMGLTVERGEQIQELDSSWQAPSSNGGSAVTGYKVQWKESADSWDIEADVSETTVTGTTHTMTGLTGGVEYAVRVIATNDVGDGPASTEATATPAGNSSEQNNEPENNAPTGLPSISGTPQVDQTLTADTSPIDDEDGLDDVSYRYQWIRSDNGADTDIPGATDSTYTLVFADQGKTIKVKVSFTDDAGNAEALTSAATVAVAAAPNRDATGAPTITGTPQVEQTLTADTSGIRDQDGLSNVSYAYQWLAGGSEISGATGPSLTLTTAHQGETIQVRVDFEDDLDNSETLTSAVTDAVAAAPAAANNPATGAPTISGTPQVEQTLTADTSPIADQDGLTNVSYRYQWIAGGTDINGATGSSFTLAASEQGQTIQIRVTFTDDADNEETLTSEATVAVAAAPNQGATGAPSISGTPQVEETLTADTSPIDDEDGLSNVSYNYRWIAGGSDIDGATGATYTLTASEEGQTIQVRVTFTDDRNNAETLTSEATVEVAAAPAPLTASLPNSRFQSARHNGAGDRPQVIVAFSLPVASFEKTTPSVSLTGATVSSVRLHEEDGLQNAWIFFLDPHGDGDIVFSLATGQPCDSGGICTEDGGMLSEGVRVTLPGPEEEDQQTPESPPAKPTNLTATVNADGHIVLSWEAPDDDSVTGYQILRRRPSEGESALLVYVADTQSTATTFTDTGVTAGVKHVYRVKAINVAGLSGWSNYVNPTP